MATTMEAAQGAVTWGTAFRVNTSLANGQSVPEITPLADGRFAVIWADVIYNHYANKETTWLAYRVQLFNADGTLSGSEITVESRPIPPNLGAPSITQESTLSPDVASLADGRFVVTWETLDSTSVVNARYYTADGASLGQVQVNASSSSYGNVNVAVLDTGQAVVSWAGGSGGLVYCRYIDANGVPSGPDLLVSPPAAGAYITSLAPLSGGRVAVLWAQTTYFANPSGVYAQILDSSGVASGPLTIVDTSRGNPYGLAEGPSLTQLAGGNIVAVWTQQSDNGPVIMGRLFDSVGVALTTEFQLNGDTGIDPDVAALPDGQFVVTWGRARDFVPMYQVLQADGTKIGTEQVVNGSLTGSGSNYSPNQTSVSVLPDGRFVVSWTGGGDIYGQIYDPRQTGVVLSGTDLGDQLTGTGYGDSISGGPGNDTLQGDAGNDVILGGTGDDYLDGGGENDQLDGGAGNDMLIGHAGDDLFFIDSLGDTVVEGLGGGLDIVRTALDRVVLAANVEGLELQGSADLAAHGSSDDNWLYGNAGANWLFGEAGNDMLEGGAGNDVLDGGAGADWLRGGAGDDVYVVDAADTVTENPGEGLDIVRTAIDGYVLSGVVEAVELQGADDLRAYGVGTNNYLYGNAGNNTLYGDAGDDLLDGGAGNDRFVGGAGNDIMRDAGGTDTFAFWGKFGIDYIEGFEAGPGEGDVVELDRAQFADLNAVVAAWQDDGSGNTVITHGSDVIVIMGVTTEQLAGNDFLIV